ncbi:MAG: stage V sporulation protein AB [Lachnospiraceae bacterium]
MILLLLIASLGFGLLASGGVLTVLVSVGLVPRFIQRAHSGKHITLLENFIIAGTIFGELWSVFPISPSLSGWLGTLFLLFFGLFAGTFEGCVALAIAEMLNTIPIAERRLRGRYHIAVNGMKPFITAVALGKMLGSLWYFMNRIYRFGGIP